jgi:chromosome segregation ATPase
MMKEQLETRLAALKTEFEAGQKMLADLEAKKGELQATMLRISGAIQVLEELLAQNSAPADLNQG